MISLLSPRKMPFDLANCSIEQTLGMEYAVDSEKIY